MSLASEIGIEFDMLFGGGSLGIGAFSDKSWHRIPRSTIHSTGKNSVGTDSRQRGHFRP